jgi:hypothetical protein
MADDTLNEKTAAFRDMLVGRFPQGVVGRDTALPELSSAKPTAAQEAAKGNLTPDVFPRPRPIPAGGKPFAGLKGGR